MSEGIQYCDVCGRLIPPGDIKEDKAVVASDGAVCAACAAAHPERARAAARGAGEAGASKSARRRLPRWGAKGPPVAVLFAVSFGVGILAITAAVVLLLPRGETTPRPLSAPERASVPAPVPAPSPLPAVDAPVPRPPAPSMAVAKPAPAEPEDDPSEAALATAGEHLVAIHRMDGPSLGRYGEMRTALVAFAEEFADAPEAGEAAKFLAEIDARYAAEAEQALADAESAARELAAAGRFDDASRMLTSLRPRYSEGDWLREQGEPRIAGALAEIVAAGERAAAARAEEEEKEAARRREESASRARRAGGGGPAVGAKTVYDDALLPDWGFTAWGGCHVEEVDGGANGSRRAIRIGAGPGAQAWCGGHVTTRGLSVAGQNSPPLSPEACANGFLVFLVNGSSDAEDRHVGGQMFQVNVAKRTGDGPSWDGGGVTPVSQYVEGKGVDADPATWQLVRVPLSAILKGRTIDAVGDVAFQYMGDAPAAGVLVDMIAIED